MSAVISIDLPLRRRTPLVEAPLRLWPLHMLPLPPSSKVIWYHSSFSLNAFISRLLEPMDWPHVSHLEINGAPGRVRDPKCFCFQASQAAALSSCDQSDLFVTPTNHVQRCKFFPPATQEVHLGSSTEACHVIWHMASWQSNIDIEAVACAPRLAANFCHGWPCYMRPFSLILTEFKRFWSEPCFTWQ